MTAGNVGTYSVSKVFVKIVLSFKISMKMLILFTTVYIEKIVVDLNALISEF